MLLNGVTRKNADDSVRHQKKIVGNNINEWQVFIKRNAVVKKHNQAHRLQCIHKAQPNNK